MIDKSNLKLNIKNENIKHNKPKEMYLNTSRIFRFLKYFLKNNATQIQYKYWVQIFKI